MASRDVVVVGDIVCDDWRFVARKSENYENAVLFLSGSSRVIIPGGAGLTALLLRQLGASVTLLSRVDTSPHAKAVLDRLREWDVNVEYVGKVGHWSMPIKTRYVNDDTILVRHDSEDCVPEFCPAGRFDVGVFEQLISDARCVVVSDYNKGYLHTKRAQLSRAASRSGVPVFVDCKAEQISEYGAVAGYKINAHAAIQFGRNLGRDAEIESDKDPCAFVYNQTHPQFVIMTTGEDGAQYHIDGQTYESPIVALQKGCNAVGAGDAFMAGAVMWLLLNEATHDFTADVVRDAVLAGQITAGAYINEDRDAPLSGAALVSEFCRAQFASKPYGKIVAESVFASFARSTGNTGKKVVFTNGCFDVLHEGHLHLLHEAKKRGDVLVVALDSDENVRRLKGPGRPIQDEQTRAKILAAMDIVDAVTIFTDTAGDAQLRRLIRNCKPHYLVKGGDYRPEDCVGWEEMTQRKNPGRVVCCSLVPDISTTKIINKVKTANV